MVNTHKNDVTPMFASVRRVLGTRLLIAAPALAAVMLLSGPTAGPDAAHRAVDLASTVDAPLPLRPNNGDQTEPGTTAEEEWNRIGGNNLGPVGRLGAGSGVWDVGAYDKCMRTPGRVADLCCVESGGTVGLKNGSCGAPAPAPDPKKNEPKPKPKPRASDYLG
ncbi:hypothetical protein A5727_18105 [Mycobacterium sp. ACS4331]|nr:hypothetical protein A5727_18105 [Mycobacterium sp. ACS4331]